MSQQSNRHRIFVYFYVAVEDAKKHHQFFRVYMRNEDARKKAREGWNTDAVTTRLSRILSVWCLSPGCTMKTIASSGIHSMLITSGTLSPMEPLLKELVIPFKVQLSNPHIIKSSQACGNEWETGFWLSDWLSVSWTACLPDCLSAWLDHLLSDRLCVCLSDCLTDRPADRLALCLTD